MFGNRVLRRVQKRQDATVGWKISKWRSSEFVFFTKILLVLSTQGE
jgi:hypothetical protein